MTCLQRFGPLLSLFLGMSCEFQGVSPSLPLKPPKVSPIELIRAKNESVVVQPAVIELPTRLRSKQVDLHRQSEGQVDILWVVDDSGSMRNQRATLVGNFERFISQLIELQVDFHVGVTSTNPDTQGRVRGTIPIITQTTESPVSVFQENTTFEASRSRWEHGLRMAELALSAPNTAPGGPNEGFLRPFSALAIIVVSDEDDSSSGAPSYYVRRFRSLKGKGNERLVSFSTIAGPTPSGCVPAGEETLYGSLAKPAVRYATVSQATGGVVGSICDASFELTLKDIALALNTLRKEFPLTVAPLEETLSVYINDVLVPSENGLIWSYQKNTQTLAFKQGAIPPPGANIRFEYAY